MRFSNRASWKLALPLVAFCLVPARAGMLEDEIRQSYDLSPTANVSIRNTDGRIMVFGSDAPRLEIVATRRAFSKERLEAIKMEVSIEGNAARVETRYPPAPVDSILADRSGTVDYVVFVPQRCAVSVELANGEVLLEGLRGERVEARLDRGLMHLRDCFTAAVLHLGEGRLRVRYGWWEAGTFSLNAEVDKGELHVAVPAGAAMHFDAIAGEGRVINYFAPEAKGLPRLDEHFGGESSVEFRLRTAAGDIRLERAY